MKLNLVFCLLAFSAFATEARSFDEIAAELSRSTLGGGAATSYWESVFAEFKAADGAADARWSALGSAADYDRLRRDVRQGLDASWGAFPARTPLNVQSRGCVRREGYVVEKLLFESRPGQFVTALLYRPDCPAFKPPYPAALFVCGHSNVGKNAPLYRRACVRAAREGLAVLAIDPIGQGERIQRREDEGARQSGVHAKFGTAAALLGRAYAAFETWDAMRALDCLDARADVRHDGYGCFGNSGGGTQTALLAATDPRVRVAAPACYLTSLREQAGTRGLADGEQISFNQLSAGFNHAGLVLMGGADVCIVAREGDFVPRKGTLETAALVKAVGERIGRSGRYAFADAPGKHGYCEETIAASVAWLRKGLVGSSDAAADDRTSDCGEELLVATDGRVYDEGNFRSVYSYLSEEVERCRLARRELPPDELSAVVRRLADIRTDRPPAPTAVTKFDPPVRRGTPILVIGEEGRAEHAARVSAALDEGRPVWVADLPGTGETRGSRHNLLDNLNDDEEIAKMLYLLGSSLVGRRAEALIALAAQMGAAFGTKPDVLACGRMAVVAAHARAASPATFGRVRCENAPKSWTESVRTGRSVNYAETVQGALCVYDWTDLLDEPPPPVVWSYWCHEPADHLRRMGGRPSVYTLGEWMPAWYERMHGEELIAKAAATGVNTLYVHYFKGFGLRHEHDEMMRTKAFVRLAHRQGVRVLGYCTFGTVYPETLADEFPDVMDWAARDAGGAVIPYGGVPGQLFRSRPCETCEAHLAYLKRVIEYGVREVGLDGFHFDNANITPCHCERCQEAFRAWLAANVPEPRPICGLAHFRHVRIPPEGGAEGEQHNPLALWRDWFRRDIHAQKLGAVIRHVYRSGGRLVVHNSGYMRPWDFNQNGLYGAAAYASEFQFAENGLTVAAVGGRLRTQVAGYTFARQHGFRLFDATWYRDADNVVTIPRDADTLTRFFAQGVVFGDVSGAAWLPRSVKAGDRVVMDDPVVFDTMRKCFGFYGRNADVYGGFPVARTHVLFSEDPCYGMPNGRPHQGITNGFTSVLLAADNLAAGGVPFLFTEDDRLGEIGAGEVLVLPEMRFTRRSQYGKIRAAAARGVRIVSLGAYGLYDENGIERDLLNPIRNLSGLAGVLRDVPDDVRVRVRTPDGRPIPGVVAATAVTAKGDFVLHLFRPGNEQFLPEIRVTFADRRLAGRPAARLLSVEDGCALAAASVAGERADVTVSGLKTMCSVVFGR